MGIRIENCETLARARSVALMKRLNTNLVVCPGCVDGTDCIFKEAIEQTEPSIDYIQNILLEVIEGRANLNKFYDKLEKHQKVIAARHPEKQ